MRAGVLRACAGEPGLLSDRGPRAAVGGYGGHLSPAVRQPRRLEVDYDVRPLVHPTRVV